MASLWQGMTSHCNGCITFKKFFVNVFLKKLILSFLLLSFCYIYKQSYLFLSADYNEKHRPVVKDSSKPIKIEYLLCEIFHNGCGPEKDKYQTFILELFSEKMFDSIVNTPLPTCKNNFGEHCQSKDQQGTLFYATRLISNINPLKVHSG